MENSGYFLCLLLKQVITKTNQVKEIQLKLEGRNSKSKNLRLFKIVPFMQKK